MLDFFSLHAVSGSIPCKMHAFCLYDMTNPGPCRKVRAFSRIKSEPAVLGQTPAQAGIAPLLPVIGRHMGHRFLIPHQDQKPRARVMAVSSTPGVSSAGAALLTARTTARYSLPWALWTVTA